MTPFQSRLVAVLRKHVNIRGHVTSGSYDGFAAELGSDVTGEDVRAALVELRDDGFFSGKPLLGETHFSGKLPG